MPRYALKIEYHGAPFAGWQRQPELQTVQGAIEAAIRKLEAGNAGITAAGRTDAGVHAVGQVAHIDMAKSWDLFRLTEAINHHLKPLPVAIVACAQVDDDFHARFGALERQYLFRVVARRSLAVHDQGLVWQVRQPLDLARMKEGAAHLLGRHDFTTFRSTKCQADSPVRTLDELSIREIARPVGQEFEFTIRARSFLHNQVRSFVGTLEPVGAGWVHPDEVGEMLRAADRTACGPVAPPQGLYLKHVVYPDDPFKDAYKGEPMAD